MPLCGNSIATDRWFIARDMPELDDWLHYRMIDVSSVKELARRWYPRAYFACPDKHGGHRALADIIGSASSELRYYRETVFVPQPGPGLGDRAGGRRAVRQPAARHAEPRKRQPDDLQARLSAALIRYRYTSFSLPVKRAMVGVAQLAEHQVVVLGVVGSSPITHPKYVQFRRSRLRGRGLLFVCPISGAD